MVCLVISMLSAIFNAAVEAESGSAHSWIFSWWVVVSMLFCHLIWAKSRTRDHRRSDRAKASSDILGVKDRHAMHAELRQWAVHRLDGDSASVLFRMGASPASQGGIKLHLVLYHDGYLPPHTR